MALCRLLLFLTATLSFGALRTNAAFSEGVASFDPTSTSIILWARYENSNATELTWQLSSSSSLTGADLQHGTVQAISNANYCVRVEVTGLTAGTFYYYRFTHTATGDQSVVARTKTLPTGDVSQVQLVVLSCASYPAGLFHVYTEVASATADAVLFLGDYIYEYGANGPDTTTSTDALGRVPNPTTDCVSLSDYRLRYKQARQDTALQAAHQAHPWIATWDDHEFANNAYNNGAQNHDTATQGAWSDRVANALQAWTEFLPTKLGAVTKDTYRTYSFGTLASLYVLENRLAREKPPSYSDFNIGSDFDSSGFTTTLNSARTMLGAAQLSFLTASLSSDPATYQVIGSPTMLTKVHVPLELVVLYDQVAAVVTGGSSSSAIASAVANFVAESVLLAALRLRVELNDPTLSSSEKARVEQLWPLSTDSWDGYPSERKSIYTAVANGGKRLISLAGDSHNTWYSRLNSETSYTADNAEKDYDFIGQEYAGTGITSRGFDGLLAGSHTLASQFEESVVEMVPEVKYLDALYRGYYLVTFTSCTVTGVSYRVDTVFSTSYSTSTATPSGQENYCASSSGGSTNNAPFTAPSLYLSSALMGALLWRLAAH